MNSSAIFVLWQRDMIRFFRQKSRIVGALAQPILFWFFIGSGLDQSFRAGATGYQEYFFPGVVGMIVLFTSIFSTMSVIDDRQAGFLQVVLVAPCSRLSVVLGKTLGGVTIALVQAGLFLLLGHFIGFALERIHWPMLGVFLFALSLALTSLGFAFAWWLDSTQAYHSIMFVLLIPAWILSGAMFPPAQTTPWLSRVVACNPLSYSQEGIRRALYGGILPQGLGLNGSSMCMELLVSLVFAGLALSLAVFAASRRK